MFRYGGEEFLVIMPATDIVTAENIAQRMAQGIAETRVPLAEGCSISCTASFGLAPLDQDIPVEQNIVHADRALYSAKSAGRKCAKVWDDSMEVFPSSSSDQPE